MLRLSAEYARRIKQVIQCLHLMFMTLVYVNFLQYNRFSAKKTGQTTMNCVNCD